MGSDSIKNKKIFDLTEVLEETNGRNNNHEVIVIDGRGYEKNIKPKDLYDVVNEESNQSKLHLNEEMIRLVEEKTEKIALDLVPEITEKIVRKISVQIAEKIIREEIEKIKKLNNS
jgi:hypothetical protein